MSYTNCMPMYGSVIAIDSANLCTTGWTIVKPVWYLYNENRPHCKKSIHFYGANTSTRFPRTFTLLSIIWSGCRLLCLLLWRKGKMKKKKRCSVNALYVTLSRCIKGQVDVVIYVRCVARLSLPVQLVSVYFIISAMQTDDSSCIEQKPFFLLMIWVKVFVIIFVWISFLGALAVPFLFFLSLCLCFSHRFSLFSRSPLLNQFIKWL